MDGFIKETGDGDVLLTVQAAPRAAKTEICGVHGDAVKIRVKAPPVDGKANQALREFIAELLGVSLRAVELVSGETSKRKIFRISGVASAAVRQACG
jgi:TIGR00251 family protein